jgi:hypothetical protein
MFVALFEVESLDRQSFSLRGNSVKKLSLFSRGLVAMAGVFAVASASAAVVGVGWTDWTSITAGSAVGTLGGATVTATASTGSIDGESQTGPGTGTGINYWTEPNALDRPYTGGTVGNAPTANEQVGLNSAVTMNVTFSSPITSLYMALLSVGAAGSPVTYDFDRAFTIDSEGEGYWGNDATDGVLGAGDTLTGREFHGLLQFTNPVTTLSFTTAPGENWHAFTFGAVCAAVDCCNTTSNNCPEPGTLTLLATALFAAGVVSRRQRAA